MNKVFSGKSMSILRKQEKILTEHADFRRKLKLSEMLKFTQEISIEHVTACGAGIDRTIDRGFLWVIGRQRFEIERMPLYDEEFELVTWPSKPKYYFMPRSYEFVSRDGENLIRGTAVWSLIDESTRHPIIPSEHDIPIIGDEVTGRELQLPPFGLTPELPNVSAFAVHYSDADINGHLNNTAYLSKVMDLIPLDYIKAHEIKALDVQYRKEIRLGEVVEMKYGLVDDAWWFACDHFRVMIQFESK